MSNSPVYLGIDLGTTNSAAAVFDNERMEMVRTAQGGLLTPSVVRIDGRGKVTVGVRARRFLESDALNTRAEFKRLMGTETRIEFPSSGQTRTPVELASEVLSSLRRDVTDQMGFAPGRAVISVPALFELPQAAATSEAARAAGFETVELIQEPIASALAAGWTQDADSGEQGGAWLVYDLGGGTFDASLLETRDGFLRVVGHDGDNFLGGRDFDSAIVDWALARFNEQYGTALSRGAAADAARSRDRASEVAIRKIRQAAEEAKIELSRSEEASISVSDLIDGHDLDLVLDRGTLQHLTERLVDRTIAVCRRLFDAHKVTRVAHVVLVGGPTLTPFLRERVSQALDAPFGERLDPMTLVAQGAAIFAASAGLDARPPTRPRDDQRKLWLQYPPVSTDLTPHLVGRIVGENVDPPLHSLRIRRDDGGWESDEVLPDAEGSFVVTLELVPRRPSRFIIGGRAKDGRPLAVHPSSITVVQGVTIGDPPLSRAIGVALANNTVQVYLERGTPLPARRTFTHTCVETLVKSVDANAAVLRIPIVQGEFERADLCRLVGALEVPANELRDTLAFGAQVEVTLDVDRSGRLSARALIPHMSQMFEQVAHLRVPDVPPEVLHEIVNGLVLRLHRLRGTGGRNPRDAVEQMEIELALRGVERDVDAAQGGDVDAAQKARRSLAEIDGRLDAFEARHQWSELYDEAQGELAWASQWIAEFGTAAEQQLFEELVEAVARARRDSDPHELQRRLIQVRRVGSAAYFRHPDAWRWAFDMAASRVDEATDLPRARKLVADGRALAQRDDRTALRNVVEELWKVLPVDARSRRQGHDSSLR